MFYKLPSFVFLVAVQTLYNLLSFLWIISKTSMPYRGEYDFISNKPTGY